MMNKKRVLIVGTVPYNGKSTSRAFDSYFHFWEKKNLAQIFSNTKKPAKGHCETLYQITDQLMLKRRFHPRTKTGIIYNDSELPEEWTDNSLEVGSSLVGNIYRLGSRKNALVYLARKWIWKYKYWCTPELNQWLDDFAPQCIFLSFSDDFFIPQIALYAAERYQIPIVSSIGDDYYFNYKFSLSPFYHIYKLSYRKLIRKVFRHNGSAIYIGDKIRDKYNTAFGLDGKTVYLTSSISRREFREILVAKPVISYFGNIRLGRNESLNEIGTVLGKINSFYVLHVYSNESDKIYYKMLLKNPNIVFHGSIPYAEVQKITVTSDIIIVVEGFKKKDVDITRYSLSTKVADALASGVNVLAYGSPECGVIEYAESTGCITTCTEKEKLTDYISELLNNKTYQKRSYDVAVKVTNEHHHLEKSTQTFESVVNSVTKE